MANLIRVFVYGTLKRGEPNHQLLTMKENGFSEFQSEGRTAEKFPLVIGEEINADFD
jgi:gamma-glutamylaminecyclotransferase